MDSITQGLLGAVSSQAIMGKKCPFYAIILGIIAATIGDLDIIIRSKDPLTMIVYHRQFSHALIAIPLGGAFIAGLFLLLLPKLRTNWLLLTIASMVAYATHIFLDVCTSFGTQIFWPWSHARITLNLLPIVDPIITFLLLAGLILIIIKPARWRALMTITLLGLYILFAAFQHHRAFLALQKILPQDAKKVEVLPTVGQLYIWHAYYQKDEKIFFNVINTPYLSKPYLHSSNVFPLYREKNLPKWVLTNKKALRDFKIFSWFSNTYLTSPNNNPTTIVNARFIVGINPITFLWGIHFNNAKDYKHVEWLRRISMQKRL